MSKIFMVIPTWNNADMCAAAIRSLFEYTNFAEYGELLVIDNSPDPGSHLANYCAKYNVRYRKSPENLGWMRSINTALADYPVLQFPFFNMCNDDVVFPQDKEFWPRTLEHFKDPDVAGVGPISNYVMGYQHYRCLVEGVVGEVPLLIGFCATYRTDFLVGEGGLDATLPGGDDLDLSIRLRARGYKLLCDRRNFVYHYGSVTGNRVHSDWDSLQSQHKTLNALIRKHGMKPWYHCMTGPWVTRQSTEESKVSLDTLAVLGDGLQKLTAHIGSLGIDVVEGSCTPKQLEFIVDQVRGCKRACEVGFNSGMSAYVMLKTNPELMLTSFDLGKWPCVRHAEDYLKAQFGARLTLHLGDSRRVVPSRVAQIYDFTLIDGGHDYETAYSDLANLAPLSRKIMMDDIRMPGVRQAWEQAVKEGLVIPSGEYMDSNTEVPRFWALGQGVIR